VSKEQMRELGLREAAREYGIDPQTIRYWIKQGWVRVVAPADGPGKSMKLDQTSLIQALRRYRPHNDRRGELETTVKQEQFSGEEQSLVGQLGLREAARKYGVDAQTIRYWIRRSRVQVIQEPSGPGKSMILDEASLARAMATYNPQRNRVGRPISDVSGGTPPPVHSNGGTAWGRRHARRGGFAAALVGAMLMVLLLIPSTVAGLAATISTNDTTYLVGEKIDITTAVTFADPYEDKVIDLDGVKLIIAGPQALNVSLPAKPGTFTQADISAFPTYSADPDGSGPLAAGDTIGTLSGTVTHTAWIFSGPDGGYGFGYGYGYTTGSNSQIGFDLDYIPPALLNPAPDANPPSYTSPTKFYGVPGGGGGGGGSTINVSKIWNIMGIPGAPPGSPIQDMDYDSNFDAVLILVDGPGSDVVGEFNATSGFMQYFQQATSGSEDATALAAKGYDWWTIIKNNSSGKTYIRNVFDQGGSSFEVKTSGNAIPTNTIISLMYDSNSSSFYAAEEQTDSSKDITIWKIPQNGGNSTTMAVSGAATGGGYGGMTALNANAFMGAFGDQAAQFDPNVQSVMGSYQIQNPDGGFDTVGIAKKSGSDQFLLVNQNDNAVYTADIPSASVVSSTRPVGMTFRTGASTNSSFILIDSGGGDADLISEVKHTSTAGDVVSISGGFALTGLSGNPVGFKAPTNNVEGLAYIHPNLYVIDNIGDSADNNKKRLYKLDVTDATKVAQTANVSSGVQGGWVKVKNLSKMVGDIGGMTVMGGKLIAAENMTDNVHIFAVNGTSEGSFSFLQNGMMYTPYGAQSIAFLPAANNFEGNNIFIVGKDNQFWQADADAGANQGKISKLDYTAMGAPPWMITGMSVKSTTIYSLDQETGAVYKGVMPGQPAAEVSTVGSYTAQLTVATSTPTASTASSTTAWTTSKVTALTLVISEPLPNQGYKLSDLTSGKITITGTINDPTVTTVGVLADLPSATLLGYDAGSGKEASTFTASADQAQYKMSGLWHFTTAADAAIHDPFGPDIQSHNLLSGTYAYFGANEAATASASKPNYCATMPGMPIPPGQTKCMVPDFMQMPSSGYFDTAKVTVSAGGDATLAFKAWWEVETAADWDNMKLQYCTGTPGQDSAGCQNLAQFAATQDMFGSFSNGDVIACSNMAMYPGCQGGMPSLIALENAKAGGALTPISFKLPSAVSGSVFFRFFFDSVDPYANHFTGILLDDIGLTGAGSLVLASATVNKATDPPTWTLLMAPEEGQNKITISATHNAYVTGGLTIDADATFFLDTQAPVLTMANLTDVTSNATLTVSGTFTEAQPKVIEMYKSVGSGSALSIGKITTFASGATTFTKNITLSEGSNKIEVRIKDMAGQCNTATSDDCTTTIADYDTVVLDTTPPVITVGETAYPVGLISARQGDLGVFQADCTDVAGFGIQSVMAASPQSPSTYDIPFRTGIPGAVKDIWLSGIVGGSANAKTYLLPMTLPTSLAPGTMSMGLKCIDKAGNEQLGTVTGTIASTLGGFIHNLMPGDNIISLPIIPAVANSATLASDISTLVAGVLSPVDNLQAIERILYYDANDVTASSADRWKIWTAVTTDTDSLTTMKPGRGYIVQMRDAAFKASESLSPGVPATKAPIALSYKGTFLFGGQSIPPVYAVEGMDATNNPAGGTWNLIGLHSEDKELVSNYFQPLESPNRIWGSALVYQNKIDYPLTASGTVTVILGAFSGLVSTDYINPGEGMWVFALADGTLVPR